MFQIVDMTDIRQRAEGHTHFFDPETLRFFDSRISQTGYQVGRLVFFVSSECFHPARWGRRYDPRLYSVRMLDLDTWRIDTHPNHDAFQAYQNRRAAHQAARAAAMAAQ